MDLRRLTPAITLVFAACATPQQVVQPRPQTPPTYHDLCRQAIDASWQLMDIVDPEIENCLDRRVGASCAFVFQFYSEYGRANVRIAEQVGDCLSREEYGGHSLEFIKRFVERTGQSTRLAERLLGRSPKK